MAPTLPRPPMPSPPARWTPRFASTVRAATSTPRPPPLWPTTCAGRVTPPLPSTPAATTPSGLTARPAPPRATPTKSWTTAARICAPALTICNSRDTSASPSSAIVWAPSRLPTTPPWKMTIALPPSFPYRRCACPVPTTWNRPTPPSSAPTWKPPTGWKPKGAPWMCSPLISPSRKCSPQWRTWTSTARWNATTSSAARRAYGRRCSYWPARWKPTPACGMCRKIWSPPP